MSDINISVSIINNQYTVFKVRYDRSVTDRNGDGEIRTHDPLLARQVLSQLSYIPIQEILIPRFNGLKWTRTIDLTLIRRAL